MKRTILLLSIILLTVAVKNADAQVSGIQSGIDSVNAVLKANPYYDGFNEIAFYYSVSISPEKELLVEMNFDGPFKWVYRAKIEELDLTPKADPCREAPSSVCWVCKTNDSGVPVSCIQAEMIMSDGGSQKENASNICVSFSARGGICSNIYKSMNRILINVLNDKQ